MNGRGNPPGFDAVVARFNLAREAGRPACVTGAEVAQAIECMQLRPTAAAIGDRKSVV